MLVFRKAELGDMPDIMRAVREAQAFMASLGIDQWQDGYPERATLERDIEIGQLYVFADDATGAIAAFAALSLLPEAIYDAIEGRWLCNSPYLTIHRMAIDDAHRGSGLAARIVEAAADIARKSGCASVRADTHAGNVAMRRFLEKHGFRYTGIVVYPVRGGDPSRVAYERIL